MRGWPDVGLLAFRVCHRNMLSWCRFWKASALANVVEPIIYLLGMGYGIGLLVREVGGISYLEFIGPGLVLSTTMFGAAFESTFGSFARMDHQKTYDAIRATPVSLDELVTGDILWSAVKAGGAGCLILGVITGFGIVGSCWALALPPALALIGFGFGSLGLVVVSYARSWDFFNYYFTLVISPMFLFSGIFFPLEELPPWIQRLAWFLPLTHGVALARGLVQGRLHPGLLGNLAWLVGFAGLIYLLALHRMRRRLAA